MRFSLWKYKGKGMEFIRFCHTCSKKEHKLVEVSWFDGTKHRFRKHWVRTGYIRSEEIGGGRQPQNQEGQLEDDILKKDKYLPLNLRSSIGFIEGFDREMFGVVHSPRFSPLHWATKCWFRRSEASFLTLPPKPFSSEANSRKPKHILPSTAALTRLSTG